MGANKKYSGYKAFQYLGSDYDFKSFVLSPETGLPGAAHQVEVSPEQEEHAQKILAESVVISLHDHPIRFPENMEEIFQFNRYGREITAYEGLSRSGLDAVFDNMLDGMATITSQRGWKWNDVIYNLGLKLCDLAHQDFVVVARKVEDIISAHKNGQLAMVLSLEAATMCENELDRIEMLYGFGVRMMGLVYSQANCMGSGIKEEGDGGLSSLGHEAVKLMNRIGMAIDVSHAGTQTAMDIIEASEKPILISHAGSKGLWATKRMMSDDAIKICAEKGGIIGIEASPHSTISPQHLNHSVYSVMDHFEYCVDLVGIDHVSFGPDSLYGDHVKLHEVFASFFSGKGGRKGQLDHQKVPFVQGMENPHEGFPNVVRWLVKHGYSDEDIKKVIGGNTIRFLKEVWWD